MTQPNYGYPMQQPGYPPAPAPQYPPQQGYPQMQPGYPPAPQYGAPQPQQQMAPPPAQGSLDAFYNQPNTGGGPAIKFQSAKNPQAPARWVCLVARDVTDADVVQQTVPGSNMPATYRDGRPKFVMKVPIIVQQSAEFPEGRAQWFCAGGAREELVRAMAEAGVNDRVPREGAMLDITKTGERPSGPGLNPSAVFRIVYTPPQGQQAAPPAQPAPSAPAPAAPPAPQAPVQQPPVQAQSAQISQPLQQAAAQAAQASVAAPPAPAQQLAPPPEMNGEQAALFAKLTAAQQGQG